jgi:hypothetical protein
MNRKNGSLLLQQKHFGRGITQWKRGGLRFQARISKSDRIWLDLLEKISSLPKRRAMRAVLNPAHPAPRELLTILKKAQRKIPRKEPINVGHGELNFCSKGNQYNRVWSIRDDGEGQGFVIVGFDDRDVIGYIGGHVLVYSYPEERSANVHIEPSMVYVIPSRRGQGFGVDLSIACTMMCTDIFNAVYRAIPGGHSLDATVYADYESLGGEEIAEYIHGCLEFEIDMLRDTGRRKSVHLGDVELDAGF